MKAFLDTHAAIFLYEGRVEQFGRRAEDLLERCALYCSPVVRLELAFLSEIGRIEAEPDVIMDGLVTDAGVAVAEDPIHRVVGQAMGLSWTRDPFDRLIVATARLHRSPLITQDAVIRQHFSDAVW